MKQEKIFHQIGTFRHYTNCRFCFSIRLKPVIHFGYVPLAGGFLKKVPTNPPEFYYPLDLVYCEQCFLLQSINVIQQDILFENYFYHSSAIKTLDNHFKEIAQEIKNDQLNKNIFIVEIGCNDGVLIKHLMKQKIHCLGVDPASNIIQPLIKKGYPVINAYFTKNEAKNIVKKFGKADVICSFNVLAHIENMHDVFEGIDYLLKDNGYLFFETHYLGNVLEETQYDMIYHEHQYYYSLITLQNFVKQFDMEIFDIKPISIHAGSMRYYIQKKKTGKKKITENVKKLELNEKKLRYDTFDTYKNFGLHVAKTKYDLLKLLKKIKAQGKRIAGYGASGRGTTIMNYCGIDKSLLDYVIDDAPAKIGKFTPGTHLPIVGNEILQSKNKPDFIVLFAWSFVDEIKKKNIKYIENGGKLIIPLPKVKIITK